MPADPEKLKHAVKIVTFNNIVFTLPVLTYPMYWTQQLIGISFSPDEIPSVFRIFVDLCVCQIAQEIAFYYAHR